MTWYEAEEIAKFIFKLENGLDEWAYSNCQMRIMLAELTRLENKVKAELTKGKEQKPLAVLTDEVLFRAKQCRQEIEERLMA